MNKALYILFSVIFLSFFQYKYIFFHDTPRDPFHLPTQQSDSLKLLGLIKTDDKSGVILKKEGEAQIVAFEGEIVWGYLLKEIGEYFVELEKGGRRVRLTSE